MKAPKNDIKPKFAPARRMKEYAYPSENRAEWARIEALGVLRTLQPFHDFNPEKYVQRKGRVLITAGLPFPPAY